MVPSATKCATDPFGFRLVYTLYVLQLKELKRLSEEKLTKMGREEEEMIYSQAMQYTTHMVNLRIPMDASRLRKVNVQDLEQRSVVGSQMAPRLISRNITEKYHFETSTARVLHNHSISHKEVSYNDE